MTRARKSVPKLPANANPRLDRPIPVRPTWTSQPAVVAAATDFAAAQPLLEAWFATHRTYAGVRLPPVYAVAVARADASSFCLQTRSGAMHEIGPGGAPQSGPC